MVTTKMIFVIVFGIILLVFLIILSFTLIKTYGYENPFYGIEKLIDMLVKTIEDFLKPKS